MTEALTRRERREQRKQERTQQNDVQRTILNKRDRNKKIINYGIIGIIVLVAVYGLFTFFKPDTTPGEHDDLAKCLTKKGVVMYGTDWCPHCQEQKKSFGNSFQYVNFINCDTGKAACDAAGVKGYPTWTFPQGESVSGEQELSLLAERGGCSI